MEAMNLTINSTTWVSDFSRWTVSHHTLEAILVPIFFALIFIFGLIGNGSLIYIIGRNNKACDAPNKLIMSLALGDLMMIVFGVPFMSTLFTFVGWPYGSALCKVCKFVETLSMAVSVLTLTALSEERYVVIMLPESTFNASHQRRTWLITAAIWIISLAFATLDTIPLVIFDSPNHPAYCSVATWWTPDYQKTVVMLQFLLLFAIPVATVVGYFSVIISRLTKRRCASSEHQNDLPKSTRAAEVRMAKVVFFMVLVYIVCWLPRHVILIWFSYDSSPYSSFWFILKIISFCVSYFNSCINPVMLYIFSQRFRELFHQYVCCRSRNVNHGRQ